MIRVLLFTLFVTLVSNAHAGFFDDLVESAKQTTKDIVDDTLDSASDKSTSEESKPEPSKQQKVEPSDKDLQVTSNASKSAPTSTDTEAGLLRAVTLATLHYIPESLDEERWLRWIATRLYPPENYVTQDEFTWNRNKADVKARVLGDIAGPATTLTATWSNKAGGVLILGEYDFDRGAFQIVQASINPALLGGDNAALRGLNELLTSQIGWLPLPPMEAEQLVKSDSSRQLYGVYDYTISGAKLHNSRKGKKYISEFKLDEIKFYRRTKQQYDYVTSIEFQTFTNKES